MNNTTASDFDADFVIVGGGSAGCVLAARLSEDPYSKVLLLEAGGSGGSVWLHVPIGFGRTRLNPKFDWCFEAEVDGGRKAPWPRGRVLGGSSAINGLMYVRGQDEDFNHWRQLGNVGWSADDVRPFFMRLEDRLDRPNPLRGSGGPLGVSDGRYASPLAKLFVDAAQNAGLPYNDDYNAGAQEGVTWTQFTTRNGRRSSSSVAYLDAARSRPNLKIVTDALAHRVVFEGKQAKAVEFSIGGETKTATARREIILTAGAIGSPQLLQLSGIGPRDVLARAGVPVLQELAGVGQNLQDHFHCRTEFEISQPLTLNNTFSTLLGRMGAGLQYILTRRGPLAMGASPAFAFVKIGAKATTPNYQLLCFPYTVDATGRALQHRSAFSIAVCALHPESRGSIEIENADPKARPRIRPNYLSTDEDRDTIVEGLKFARRIAASAPLSPVITVETRPGRDVTRDDELLDYARTTGGTSYHPVGTARMGTDDGAVCTPDLKVRGIEGLRVADASIMPTITSGNTNAPVIMIAEKLADMMRGGR